MQIFFIFYFHFSIRRISNHIHLYICTYIYICIWHKKKRKGVAYCYFVLFAGLFVSFSYKRRKEELPLSGWRKLNNWSWHNTQQGVQDLCLNSISRFFGRLLAVYGWGEGGERQNTQIQIHILRLEATSSLDIFIRTSVCMNLCMTLRSLRKLSLPGALV